MKTFKRILGLTLALALIFTGFIATTVSNIVKADAIGTESVRVYSVPSTLNLKDSTSVKVYFNEDDFNLTEGEKIKVVRIYNSRNALVFDSNTTDAELVNNYYTFTPANTGTYRIVYGYLLNGEFVRLTKEYQVVVSGIKPGFVFEENSNLYLPTTIPADENLEIVIPTPSVVNPNLKEDDEDYIIAEPIVNDVVNPDITISVIAPGDNNLVLGKNATETNYTFKPFKDASTGKVVTGIYNVSFSYNKNGVSAYKVVEVYVSATFSTDDISYDVSLNSTMPTTIKLGEETTLPSVKVVDANSNNADITANTYTVVSVKYVPAGQSENIATINSLEMLKNGYTFVATEKTANGGEYYVEYNVYDIRKGAEPVKTLKYTISTAKDSTAPTPYAVEEYNVATAKADNFVYTEVEHAIPANASKGTLIMMPAIYATDNVDAFADITLERRLTTPNSSNVTSFYYIATGNYESGKTYYLYQDGEMVPAVVTVGSAIEGTVYTRESRTQENNAKYAYYLLDTVGTYTIAYRATDTASNANYTKVVYKITVKENFVDETAPTIKVSGIASTYVAGSTITFVAPVVKDYKENSTEVVDSNPEVTVTVTINGDTYRLNEENGSYSVKLPDIVESLSIVITAKDDSNNVATYTIGTSETSNKVVTIIGNNDTVAPASETLSVFNADEYNQKDVIRLLDITFTDDNAQYLGQPVVTLVNPNNAIVKNGITGAINTTFVKTDDVITGIRVSGGEFVATLSGKYYVIYTVSDASGNSVSYRYGINVKDTVAPIQSGTEYTVPTTAKVGETIILPEPIIQDNGVVITNKSDVKVQIRNVTTSDYYFNPTTLELKFYSEGEISFVYIYSDGTNEVIGDTVYTISVTDTDAPALNIDSYPYSTNPDLKTENSGYAKIKVPYFRPDDGIGTGIRTYYVEITHSNSTSVLKLTDNELDAYDVGEPSYIEFEPKEGNGVYTVKYYAEDYAGNTTSDTLKISVGDVDDPDITVIDVDKLLPSAIDNTETVVEFGSANIKVTDDKDATLTWGNEEEFRALITEGRITIAMTGPNGDTVDNENAEGDTFKYTLSSAGSYTLKITAKDKAGHTSTYTRTISVTAEEHESIFSNEAIGIILIIVSVLILAGVLYYFIKTRDRKEVIEDAE